MLQHGISHVMVAPDAHAQNGRVERAHLTILDDVRTLLLQSGLPPSYWAEAANYSVYVRNHTFANNKQVPLDLWYNQTTKLDHLQPFGCKVYYREHTRISKLQPRYKEGRLLGWLPDSHTCRILDSSTKKTVGSQDVVFAQDKGILQTLQNLQNSDLQNLELHNLLAILGSSVLVVTAVYWSPTPVARVRVLKNRIKLTLQLRMRNLKRIYLNLYHKNAPILPGCVKSSMINLKDVKDCSKTTCKILQTCKTCKMKITCKATKFNNKKMNLVMDQIKVTTLYFSDLMATSVL